MAEVSERICAGLKRGDPSAPATWARLKQESPHLRDAILKHHPQLRASDGLGEDPLGVILGRMPKALGLRAVRRCITSYPDGPHLAIDISEVRVNKA